MRQTLQALRALIGETPAVLADIGASGGRDPIWDRFGDLVHTIGFEPDAAEFEKLVQTESNSWRNVALAGTAGERTLYVTRSPSNTSLLKPNRRFLNTVQFQPKNEDSGHEVIKELSVHCITLDEALQDLDCRLDVLKLDTQGTELEILGGAERGLSNCTLIEIEVEFAQIYEQQPLFADVDAFLRSKGFILLDLGRFLHLKSAFSDAKIGTKNRIIDCDALYVRDFYEHVDRVYLSDLRNVGAAVLGLIAYGYIDAAISLLRQVQESYSDYREQIDKLQFCLSRARQPGDYMFPFIFRSDIVSRIFRRMAIASYGRRYFYREVPLGNRNIILP